MNPTLKPSESSARLLTTPTTRPFKKRTVARLCKLNSRKLRGEDEQDVRLIREDVVIQADILKTVVVSKVVVDKPLDVAALKDATAIGYRAISLITSVTRNIKRSSVNRLRRANYKLIMLILMPPIPLFPLQGAQYLYLQPTLQTPPVLMHPLLLLVFLLTLHLLLHPALCRWPL